MLLGWTFAERSPRPRSAAPPHTPASPTTEPLPLHRTARPEQAQRRQRSSADPPAMTALIRASAERIESEGIPVGVNRHRRGWERVNPDGRRLGRALHLAKVTGATLVVAKLDRGVAECRLAVDAAVQRRCVRGRRPAGSERPDRRHYGW